MLLERELDFEMVDEPDASEDCEAISGRSTVCLATRDVHKVVQEEDVRRRGNEQLSPFSGPTG